MVLHAVTQRPPSLKDGKYNKIKMSSETRSFPRKPLRAQARIALPGAAPLRGKTVDISQGGVSLIVTEQIPVGQVCSIAIDVLANGKVVCVAAVAKAVYSILKGTDGYRTGMQFIEVDKASHKALEELML